MDIEREILTWLKLDSRTIVWEWGQKRFYDEEPQSVDSLPSNDK